jgi:hypothetical protein
VAAQLVRGSEGDDAQQFHVDLDGGNRFVPPCLVPSSVVSSVARTVGLVAGAARIHRIDPEKKSHSLPLPSLWRTYDISLADSRSR